ncbi:MAG TPA: cupredoxin family copper-binding protein [Candidatus Cybelea sp.]|jgi:plastocyanin|nr:cupredoxin family copper-binding protein [Candidatus Cybelea sp.]
MKRFLFLVLAPLLVAPAAAYSATPAVHIKNDAFIPRNLSVNVGQTVTFTNDDDDAHTVTATDGTFDSKGLDTNGVWRHAFSKPGTYSYFCELHPFMKGTIVVTAVRS